MKESVLFPFKKITKIQSVHCAMKNVANFSRFRPTKIIDMSDLVIVSDSNGYYKLRAASKQKEKKIEAQTKKKNFI